MQFSKQVISINSIFNMLTNQYGQQQAFKICLQSNKKYQTVLRTNTIKTSRQEVYKNDQLIGKLKKYSIIIQQTKESPYGIRILEKDYFNLNNTQQFKNGDFQIQDEGSQLIGQYIKPKKQNLILDYCAGAGGKSLMMASLMQNKGKIYLYDINKRKLNIAFKKIMKASITNAIICDNYYVLKRLFGKFNKVIIDVPCTGSGIIKKKPEIKLRFSKQWLNNLVNRQQIIFDQGIKFMSKEGSIFYITCSLFKQQNQQQIQYFIKKYGLKQKRKSLKLLPSEISNGYYAIQLSY